MASGDVRLRARVWVIAIGFALLVGGLWWWQHGASRARRATPTVAESPRTADPQRTHGPGAPDAPAAPARLMITVRDARGPIADASVRLAPADGEIVVVRTGGDGVARADGLEPGRWKVSASAAEHAPAALPTATLAAGSETALAIVLVSGGRTLRGTVSDTTGGPIGGVRIDAARLTAAAKPGDAIATTFTAADGSYRVSVAEGVLTVAATSADYAPQARTIEIGAAGAVADFALVPGGVVEGIVRDDRTKQPVAGARVVAVRDRPTAMMLESGERRATSGADGRFRLAGLRPGAWELAASDAMRFSRAAVGVGLGVAEQVTDVELWIGASPVIRGTVVDETGAAVANAKVRAFSRDASGEATSDATGGFVLTHLRPADYQLTAESPSHVSAEPVRAALTSQDIEHLVVSVRRATSLRGHVEPRQPCEVQQVIDMSGGLPMMRPGVSTGPDGEFAIGPDRDGPARLTARCASGDQGTLQVTVSRGMAEVALPVTPGASIAGHVVDGDGKAVAGVGVIANELGHGEHTTISNGVITSGAQVRTDATGAYVLDGLSPGTYGLGVLDRGVPMVLRTPAPKIVLAGSERKVGVELAIDRPNGTISGTVTGPDGKPLPDAWVSAEQDMMAMMHDSAPSDSERTVTISAGDEGEESAPPPVLTDAQGHYELRGLARGIYGVTAEAQRGQLRASVARVRPSAKVDLKLLGVAVLSGTVTGPAGPAALFSVELEGPSLASRSFTDGAFSFGRVDPGTYTLRVESTDGTAEAKVEVKPGEPAKVAMTLEANATLTGRLVDAAGKPLAGVPVTVMKDRGEKELGVMINGPPPSTGPDGSFRIVHRAELSALVVLLPQSSFPRPFYKRGLVLEPGKTLDLGTVPVTSPDGGAGSGAGSPKPPQRDNRAPPDVITASRR